MHPQPTDLTRLQKLEEVRRLRDVEGLTFREIGERFGRSLQWAHELYSDPTGEKVRARKQRYDRPCSDCGKILNHHRPHRPHETTGRCKPCLGKRTREASRRWIIESFAEWTEMTGGIPPVAADWHPSHARVIGQDWRAERLEDTARPWPSVTLVQSIFGSWRNGLLACGYDAFTQGHYGREGEYVTDEQRAEMVRRYEQGESAEDIAADQGVSRSLVIHQLRLAGVTRSRREAAVLRWGKRAA